MSYYRRDDYGRGWTSVEDIEKTLVSASRITQDSVGAQRTFVPPIPVPQELHNKLPEDPYSVFNRRHNGQSIMGRGQMIIEQGNDVRYRDYRISQDLQNVPVCRGYSNFDVQKIISSSGQFVDDDSEEDPDEPSFGDKITSTPSTSGIKEAVGIPNAVSPSARTGLDFAESLQDAVGPSGADDTDPLLDHPNESNIQPDVTAGSLELPSDHAETSLDQPESSYLDPFYYTFDDSIYIKVETPMTFVAEAPTPSPCSSPLPHHSTIDGHYVGCVQMESDSSSSPSPITVQIDGIDPRNVADDFSSQLRSTLPDDYKEVMSIWKDYQAGQITASSLELQISRLLGPYPDLMDAFFKFTSLSTSEEPESLISESFNGELPPEPVCEVIEVPDELIINNDLEVPDEPISEFVEEPNVEVSQDPVNEVQNESIAIVPEKTRAAMFEDYIRFCRLVRNKFANQPAIFSEFLALLNDHKESKIDRKSLVEGATHLFRFHLDLVEGFKKLTIGNFCSVLLKTAGSVAAKSAVKKVARLTDSTKPRRCRNALILNLLKKEADCKQDSITHNGTEMTPMRLVSDRGLKENHVDKDEMISIKACDENGNSEVKESVGVLNGLAIPSSTTLVSNSADSAVSEIRSTVLDNNVIYSSNDVLCGIQGYDDMQVQTEPLCNLTTAESNLERVSNLEVVDSLTGDLRLGDLAKSLPLTILEKPLELLKPEDIIPDMNAEKPHNTLEIAHEIVSSVMDSVMIQDAVQELEVAFVEDSFIGSSEACVKSEIELLKPSDFVHLGSEVGGDDEIIIVPDGSIVQSPDEVILDEPENVIVVEIAEKVAAPGSAEVVMSDDDIKSVEVSSSVSVEAISSSEDIIVISADSTPIFANSDLSHTDLVPTTSGVLLIQDQCCGVESTSDVPVMQEQCCDVESTSDVALMQDECCGLEITYDVPLMQDQCCGVDSTSDPIQISDALEINTEQELETVVVALAKMDLNSDPDSGVMQEPVIKLELPTEADVLAKVLPLSVSSDEISIAGSSEMAADEPIGAEVTMTVKAITSDMQTSDVDQSPDQSSGSVPQLIPDCGPLLFRPDQFVTLSAAVEPHQVEQALEKHNEAISLD